ncbi:MAG: TldD/PmbA family protein [Chloroflexi bacterium]|nr:TldD/PmbA family protein [Chloroflexota bacterium]
MLGPDRVRRTLFNALSHSTASQTEAVFTATRSALTRFANNVIHQNVAENDATLQIRAAFGLRVGTATTNDLSDTGIARVVDQACEIASHQPENPEFAGLPEPAAVREVDAWDEAVAGASPELRARAIGVICGHSARAGLIASGAFSTDAAETAVANSNDLFAYHPATSVELTLVVQDGLGSGYAHGAGWRLAQVDTEALCLEAVERAILSRNPRPIGSGEYPIVLDAYAVLDVLESLAEAGMGALAVQEGRSWMNGRQGRPSLSSAISIWDDGLDAAGFPTAFDCEGVPKRRVDIVRAGVPQEPVYDTHTAAKEPGRRSTGHAQPYDDDDWDGPMPENLFIAPGDLSVSDLIREMDCGLYVTRFHYTNLVSEHDCGLTGTTRDGAWWVERGELAYPVQTLRFDQKIVPALRGVSGVGKDLRTLQGFYGTHRVPPVALDNFRFIQSGG